MAARSYWKGYLKLSLVSCPIALSRRPGAIEPHRPAEEPACPRYRIWWVSIGAALGDAGGANARVARL